MEKKMHFYECPVCGDEYVRSLNQHVHNNLVAAFPVTYGMGLLICDMCTIERLEYIKASAQKGK